MNISPFGLYLVKIISRIEDYRDDKDYLDMFNKGTTIWDKLHALKLFYKDSEDNIVNLAKSDIRKFYDIFSFWFEPLFSPIELLAWHSIRCQKIVLYPQYPALNYILDFANPHLKIVLELDGKEFHDSAKDKLRDQKLFDLAGWKVFRISGAEANRYIKKPILGLHSLYQFDELKNYFHTTLDGIIEAINQVYFYKSKTLYNSDEEWIYETCIETLNNHRLAKFDL